MKQTIKKKNQTLAKLSYKILNNQSLNKLKVNIQEVVYMCYNLKTCYHQIKMKANAWIIILIQNKKW